MGINLALVLGHSLGAAELLALREHASASPSMRRSAGQLWQVMRPRWANLHGLEEFAMFVAGGRLSEDEIQAAWARGDTPSYQWAGFHLYFGRRAIQATHMEKLAGFVLDLDQLRDPLQACAKVLACELRSPFIVYGPDSSSPFEEALEVGAGSSLPELLSIARRKCGDPAPSIREMADAEEDLRLDRNCYHVENIDLGETRCRE
ncbi:MAG: hypothetical protein WD069_09495 [Planctomycetales bacterium]